MKKLPPLPVAMLAVASAWAVAFEIARMVSLISTNSGNSDFRLFYDAGEAGRNFGWSRIYDPFLLNQLGSTLGAGNPQISATYAYQYPPLVALLVAPLVSFPLPMAFTIWTLANVGAVAVACRLAFSASWFTAATAFLATLALWPAAFALERGQPEFLVYGLAIACWWAVARGHDRVGGLLLALAWALKPQDVLLLPAVLFVGGYVRTAFWWLLASAAIWVVFASAIGPDGIGGYIAVMAWSFSDPKFTATPLATPFGTQASLYIGQAAFAAVALFGAWRRRHSLEFCFAIGIVGTLVSGVHLHEYDFVGSIVAAWLLIIARTSIADIAWLGLGATCLQLTSISIRLPVLIWQAVWLFMLVLSRQSRGTSAADVGEVYSKAPISQVLAHAAIASRAESD